MRKFRIDEAAAEDEFGMLCQRLLPWSGQAEEPPFGAMACFLQAGGSSAPDCHAQVEVMLVLSGTGTVDVAGEREAIAAGDVVVIERDLEHIVHNPNGDALRWVSLYWPLHEPGT